VLPEPGVDPDGGVLPLHGRLLLRGGRPAGGLRLVPRLLDDRDLAPRSRLSDGVDRQVPERLHARPHLLRAARVEPLGGVRHEGPGRRRVLRLRPQPRRRRESGSGRPLRQRPDRLLHRRPREVRDDVSSARPPPRSRSSSTSRRRHRTARTRPRRRT
jgi:hypothetical protein